MSYEGARPPLALLTTFVTEVSSDNRVSIGRGFRSSRLVIAIDGHGNRIEIGRDVTLTGRIRVSGNGLTVRIGDRSQIKGGQIVAWDASVEIGADCLFARRVLVRTSDIHPIVDRRTGVLLNPPAHVRIGDGVWIALEAAILKGAVVPAGCVVGMRAVVTRRFDEEGCVLAGTPARVIRRDVAWTRYDYVTPTLPADFDGARYLALHPGVAAAAIEPGLHYLTHGVREGRPYK